MKPSKRDSKKAARVSTKGNTGAAVSKTDRSISKNVSYFGCRVRQRKGNKPAMFVFIARASEVAAWAGIRRVQDTRKGTQRIHRPPRSRAITRFLEVDDSNTIPNNLLLAFLPGVATFAAVNLDDCSSEDLENRCGDRVEWGVISFAYTSNAPEHRRPALIVDGQHRLKGISAYGAEDLPIFSIALLDASVEEQAFQFIVINNKSTRVPSDNVKAIISNMDEARVRDRLLKSGVSYGRMTPALKEADTLRNSPFRGMLKWPNNDTDDGVIPLTAIEQMLRYVTTAFSNVFDTDEDSPLDVLFVIWFVLAKRYKELWHKSNPATVASVDKNEPEGEDSTPSSRFMSKVNLTALNEFVIDRLKILWETGYLDLFEDADLTTKVEDIASRLPVDFWNSTWVRLADNSAFKNMLKNDLVRLTENAIRKQKWHEGVKVLLSEMPDSELSDDE